MDRADTSAAADAELVVAAGQGDAAAFERLAGRYRGPLRAYCYRMLGSVDDADDAVQDALLGAWRGIGAFERRSSVRTWLYRIATNACLRLLERRPRRLLSPERGPSRGDVHDLGEPVPEPVWLEPYPDVLAAADSDPEARYQQRESVELAFVAALQHLPATQRAVLVLRDVLRFSAAETAAALGTSVPTVNSALQRARKAAAARAAAPSQHAELRALGEHGRRELVDKFVAAWERADVDTLVGLLAEDARFSMPPLPAWFAGTAAIRRFLAERAFATPWRLRPAGASGQLAFACYRREDAAGPFRLGAINVLTLRDGLVAGMTGFLDPRVHRHFGLPLVIDR